MQKFYIYIRKQNLHSNDNHTTFSTHTHKNLRRHPLNRQHNPVYTHHTDNSYHETQHIKTGKGVKQLRHEADHSPPPTTEVKNGWSYTSTPPVCLDGVDRDNFTYL